MVLDPENHRDSVGVTIEPDEMVGSGEEVLFWLKKPLDVGVFISAFDCFSEALFPHAERIETKSKKNRPGKSSLRRIITSRMFQD